MSAPFKMKGSSALGYGNQHSKGKGASSGAPKMYDSPAPMMDAIAGIAGKLMSKKDEEPSGVKYASPAKETDEEFEAKLKASGMTVSPSVEVKKSDNLTQRDILAKQAKSGKSGITKPGMEQSAKSKNYDDADKHMASKGDENAKKLLRKKAVKVAEVKKIVEKNPNMTQKEIDKLMSQQ